MNNLRTVIIVLILLLQGCASTEVQMVDLKPKSRVGLINMVGDEITHTHVGTTSFNNFSKKYDIDWNISSIIEDTIVGKIKKNTHYDVIKINPTEKLLENDKELVEIGWASHSLKESVVPEFKNIFSEYDVDIILVIREFGAEDYVTQTGTYIEGYGLYTRSFLVFEKAYAYGYLKIDGIFGDPPAYIGGQWFGHHPVVNDFNFPEDIKNIPSSELKKIEPFLLENVNKFVEQALKETKIY